MNLTGRTLSGRYYLRELIDSGGMADVYLAWDQQRSVHMAIKVLRRDLMSRPNVIQLFRREAHILHQLEHPNIVRLYEFDQDGDNAFFVMDWVEGGNVGQLIQKRQGPLSVQETARILAPVCSALHYAHRSQIYHCDLKPTNIMLHADGRILLSDFGVARLAGDEIDGGTPAYMAPEQFDDRLVDARTDVYGLGVTLYEMLSGRQPFRGDSDSSKGSTQRDRIAWEHFHMSPPSLALENPRVTPAVEAVVAKAMSKHCDQRYAGVTALREAYELAAGSAPGEKDADRTVIGETRISPVRPVESGRPPGPDRLPPPRPRLSEPAAPPPPRPSSPEPPRTRGPYLYCRQGVLAGKSFGIPPGGLTIGRGSQCSLHIAEPSVSRKHATIECGKRGKLYLHDDGSSLGTYVNGTRINSTVLLKPGDIVSIGRYVIFELRET